MCDLSGRIFPGNSISCVSNPYASSTLFGECATKTFSLSMLSCPLLSLYFPASPPLGMFAHVLACVQSYSAHVKKPTCLRSQNMPGALARRTLLGVCPPPTPTQHSPTPRCPPRPSSPNLQLCRGGSRGSPRLAPHAHASRARRLGGRVGVACTLQDATLQATCEQAWLVPCPWTH